jgi:hypothetical protein
MSAASSAFYRKSFLEFLKSTLLFFPGYTHAIACSTAMTPEQRARQQIDLLLQQSGWIVQDRSQTNLAAGLGVAIREALLKSGEADYLLFAGGKAIATVEAKPEGYTLTGVEGRSPASMLQVFWTFIPAGATRFHLRTRAPVLRPVSVTGLTRTIPVVACSRFIDPRHS